MVQDGKPEAGISRRNFIRTSAAGIGTAALVGMDRKDVKADSTPVFSGKWDLETDVVVVGYGGAGIVTAITAHDAGARVLVVEKAPFRGGGNTSICMGACASPTSAEDAAAYLWEGCGGNDPGGSVTPKEVIEAWAEEICKNKAWWDKMGIKYRDTPLMPEFENFPGASSMAGIGATGMGQDFFATLEKHVKERGIEVLFDSPAVELIQEAGSKQILGVMTKNENGKKNIKAGKAVVLCTGGFEYNDEMKKNFLKCYPAKFNSWKYNTGDGVTMAQKVGADLWHMDLMAGGSTFWFPEDPHNTGRSVRTGTDNYIWVDRFGRRYRNEKDPLFNPHKGWVVFSEFDLENATFSRIPTHLIFDETARKASAEASSARKMMGASGNNVLPEELRNAPSMSQDEMIAVGWIKKADTLEALAAAIGDKMDPALLTKSVETYNRFCEAGEDKDFARKSRTLKPVETPPFYAASMFPGGVCTHGGARRNGKAQILNPDRKPIPRLYSAGSFGSVMGRVYSVFGGNMGELCAFGRIAGRNAAAEKPWG
jgi:succinate dehydrogenase/fumarate reductase flavoprotein subunit